MNRKMRFLRAALILALMGLGYGMLLGLLQNLNVDNWQEYALLMLLTMVTHWLGISLSSGNLNAGFTTIFSSFLIFGSAPAVWIGTLATLFSNGIINRGQPLRQTLFMGAQTTLAITLAAYLYTILGGADSERLTQANWLPLAIFVAVYFLMTNLLTNFYLNTYSRRDRRLKKLIFKWDSVLFACSVFAALVLVYVYSTHGLFLMALAFAPVIFLQKLIQLNINLDIANKELKALYQVTKTIGNELDLQKTLDAILEEIKGIVDYHTGVIYLYQEGSRTLIPKAVVSPYSEDIKGDQVVFGEGLVGLVAESKEAELIEDVDEEPLLKEMPGIHQFLRSLLVVPMLVSNRVVGVIAVGSKSRGEFTEGQLKILAILAGQAAVATANSLLYKRMGDLAVTDGLTKVYNHRFFYNKLEEEFNHCLQHCQPLSVMLIDLDNFKRFNDRFGHLSGDMALNTIAKIIKKYCRARDTLARYGGEEFALILPGTNLEGALQVAERIRSAVVGYPFKPKADYPAVNLSVSIGLASCSEGKELRELVEEADKALYQAKRMGRNRVEISKN